MNQAHLSTLTPNQIAILVPFLFLFLYIYFLPTITAFKKNSPHKTAVIILDIFFGFTLLGWIFALVLATKQPQQVAVVYNTPPPPR